MVIQATGGDEQSQVALERLCVIYWSPLYAFARRTGWSREDAEDATQDFFRRLCAGEYLDGARKEKGRLRSFLLICFKRFLGDKRAKGRALKRGGGREILSFDVEGVESLLDTEAGEDSPERIYEKRWAHALMAGVMEELETEYGKKGKEVLFVELKEFLMPGVAESGQREAAARLGMQENAVGVAVYRLRRRFGELMKRQVLATVEDESQVAEELRYLMGVLA